MNCKTVCHIEYFIACSYVVVDYDQVFEESVRVVDWYSAVDALAICRSVIPVVYLRTK